MKLLRRVLCMLLCVVILAGTIGSKYFDANHMERVEAAAEAVAVGLSAAALYAICFYVGTVAYAHAPIETNTLSDDQIARMGYNTISYMTASNLLGIPAAPNSPLIGFIDKAGRSYVFGSEAFKAVAETSFQVIQGGKKPDDDDDEEGGIIDNLIRFPGNVKNLSGVCTAAFAGILGSVIKDQYDKFMNDGESIYQAAVAQNFDGYEQNADGTYYISGVAVWDELNRYTVKREYDFMSAEKIALYYSSSGLCPEYWTVTLNGDSAGIRYKQTMMYFDGSTKITNGSSPVIGSGNYAQNFSMSINIPVFATKEAALAALQTGDCSEALNCAKGYRIADWLQEDWAGVLLDPLTGLHALGDWANIARHQGLSALGNELDLASFLNYLRDYFANLGQNPLPEVDPGKAPVLYPSGDVEGALDPDTDIDPSRKPAILPDPSISPAPKPDPDPGTDPDPRPDPDPDPEPLPLPDMDAADYKVELSGIFPFCIPFDFIALLKTLEAEPRAPCFTFPVVIPALSYREDVKLDLSIFDDVAAVIRLCGKVSFILFLMFVTSKVIRW